MASLTVVTGAARSGKSRWAEHLATQAQACVVYIATAAPVDHDPDWQRRLELHRDRRPEHWQCWEVGAGLAPALDRLSGDHCALVDSIGSWVAQGLALDQQSWQEASDHLLASVERSPAQLLLVSEQTGWGVVPATAIGGLFRDRLGQLEQRLVNLADRVWLVVAGRAVDLTALGVPVPPLP